MEDGGEGEEDGEEDCCGEGRVIVVKPELFKVGHGVVTDERRLWRSAETLVGRPMALQKRLDNTGKEGIERSVEEIWAERKLKSLRAAGGDILYS